MGKKGEILICHLGSGFNPLLHETLIYPAKWVLPYIYNVYQATVTGVKQISLQQQRDFDGNYEWF